MEACFELRDILNERFRWRVCSKKTQGFTFDKPFSNPWWVAGREESVLESFCGLKMCADIKDCLPVKSFTFEKSGIQEVYFFVWDSAINFIGSGDDCLLGQ